MQSQRRRRSKEMDEELLAEAYDEMSTHEARWEGQRASDYMPFANTDEPLPGAYDEDEENTSERYECNTGNENDGTPNRRRSGAIARARLTATFYPKFENEKSDQEIRTRMVEVVGSGRGVLEVSFKHSGSLFMYSGDKGGAYAKNSFGNLYTAVGVYVLGKTFQAAWGKQAATKQREFNAYLEAQHLCVSMELVTAVLGDHGQRPREDYVVVTAIANLEGKPHFYSTPDVISFCWKWRLPNNQVWLFSSRKSAISFFTAYDALCEEGTATVVTKTLDQISDISVPAIKSHTELQGEILEGLVARIVSSESVDQMQKVLGEFPSFNSTDSYQTQTDDNLRAICAKNRASEKQQVDALLKYAGPNICSDLSDWESDDRDASLFNAFVNALPADCTTAKLKELIQVLKRRNMRVRFPCRVKGNKGTHFKMTIHVLNDSVFRRYQKEMSSKPGLWPLYRGFFAEIYLFDGTVETNIDTTSHKDDVKGDQSEHLMLKLKLLPYKIRTFLIRNGLSVLFNKGISAYKTYYKRQMNIWNTSSDKQRQLDEMLSEWARYITSKYSGKGVSAKVYLSEAEPFLERFGKRSATNQRLVGFAGTTIRTENFLCDILAEDDDEPTPTVNTQVDTKASDDRSESGVLVFFPGIPGCGKSALCQELLKQSDVLSHGRTMHSLMGDRVKGKYWPILGKEHKKRNKTFTLADKNAPNFEVWSVIEEICQSSSSIGIPVVPDSKGTESNPFSLELLALFMYRVLQRDEHPGNLDKDSTNVGYVLLMFYHLYDGKDRSEFEDDLIGRFGYLVKQPILKPNSPDIPASVLEVITQGIDLYHRHTSQHGRMESSKGRYKKEWSDWEMRLRGVMQKNAEYFADVQVPFEEVVCSVRQQIIAIIRGETPVQIPTERSFRSVKYAALSFSLKDIANILSQISHSTKELERFMEETELESKIKTNPHITLAHKAVHGVAAVASFGEFRDKSVNVQFTALLFSPELCALEANILENSMEIQSKNEWAHVTVWTAKGRKAKECNHLPGLVSEGKASRVDFANPMEVLGKVELL